jgi:UDP-glucose 4-epimerase
MRVLLTGGAGFIGSHLCDRLIADGHAVDVLDDFSTGREENIAHLRANPLFRCTRGSVSEGPILARLVDAADVVVHLAAAVGVKLVVEAPVRAIETNVHCTEVVLAHADRAGKPVLLASTSEVYGKSAAIPFREDGDLQLGAPSKARWSYACSKAIDEFLAMAYARERDLPVTVVRLFNTVGPRQTGRYGMVVPRLVSQALTGAPLSVYGDGSQSRCFCHVTDVVGALTALLREPAARGEVYNVGANTEVSIRELAERVIALTDSTSTIQLTPYEDVYGEGFEDMQRRVPDTAKIHALLGWRPAISLEQIILDVAEHIRNSRPLADRAIRAGVEG